MTDRELALHGGAPVARLTPMKYTIGKEESDAVRRLIDDTGILSSFRGGEKVREFEVAFAKYVGAKYAIATTSGTAALHASVAALNLSSTDEVIVPAMTFVSTASVVAQEGATVVFADVDKYYGLDPVDLEKKITEHTRAIIPVHLYGQPVNMKEISRIAKKHSLVVIEDACQSHGATLDGVKTGALGDVGCFSFFQSKNMTTGEGGMITTSSEELYEKMRLRREHGSPSDSKTWYDYRVLGFNYNMTEMQGAVGVVQLQKLDNMNAGRVRNAKEYDTSLKGLGLTVPAIRSGVTHVHHNYPVLLPKLLAPKRDFFVEALRAEGVPVDVAYPHPLYKSELFINLGVAGDCPKAEDYTSRLFNLFTDVSITTEVVADTVTAVKKVLSYIESHLDEEH